ncbi:MAG: hypothetical protein IJ911_12335 [Salinivirgaceae bacterium]|nr:hypothetical protein [Salinivirgaceae bacterium]
MLSAAITPQPHLQCTLWF